MASIVPLCVCLRSRTEKGTTGISLKKEFKKCMQDRKRGGWPPLFSCVSVCLRSHTEKGTNGISLKKNLKNGREKERWVASIVQLCVCLSV